jgi:DUF1680 family protein
MKNIKFIRSKLSIGILLAFLGSGIACAVENKSITGAWQPLQVQSTSGIMGERFDLYRNIRVPYLLESGYLIDGFESRPGVHAWQGEHLGKYIHTVVMDYLITKDPNTKKQMEDLMRRLLATQLEDGYLGTYSPDITFMRRPENGKLNDDVADDVGAESNQASKKAKGGWDVWTFRYNLHGLLFYNEYFPNQYVLEACKEMGDLLISIYGPGNYNLTKYGTRKGISATVLLESVVMLYEQTGEQKYLDFAEHIVSDLEANPDLDITNSVMNNEDLVHPGEGKAYQLMSTLLGYYRLYLVTHNEKYLDVFEKSWEVIKEKHLTVAGGPWSVKMKYNGNKECFARMDGFSPAGMEIEGCSNMSWLQMCADLYELTGDPKYIKEAEFNFYNSSIIHQNIDGLEYTYYTKMNRTKGDFTDYIHCCSSSIPRGMYVFAQTMLGHIDSHLIIGSLSPYTASLTEQFGGGTLKVESAFPYEGEVAITLSPAQSKSFPVELVIPKNTSFQNVKVNGIAAAGSINKRGNYEINGTWNQGDTITIGTQYELIAHTQRGGENNLAWVAFTYGPIALAQETLDLKTDEPFINYKEAETSKMADMLVKASGSEIAFTVKGSDITFIPIWETANEREFSGTKSYFGIEGNPNKPPVEPKDKKRFF